MPFAFILMVRHPLDVLASIEETPMSRILPNDTTGRAQHIRNYMETGLSFCRKNPTKSIVVRYEDLVLDPLSTLRTLLAFLGEDFSAELLRAFHSSDSQIGLGDPKANSHSRITSESVGRWRRSLSHETLDIAMPLLAPIAENLYPGEST